MGLRRCSAPLLLALVALTPTAATAELKPTLAVQGTLTTLTGTPAPDGDYAVTFRFYTSAEAPAGVALTTYVHPAVTATSGTFSVSLGDTLPLDTQSIEAGQATWLGVQVGADPELPRVRLHHVPYAMRAKTAADLSCTGCVGPAQLAAGTLSAYAKTSDLEGVLTTDALADYAKTADLADYAKTADLAPVATAGTWASLTGKPEPSPADGMTAAGVANLKANALYDGSTPWTASTGTLQTELLQSNNSTGAGQTLNCTAGYKLMACTCSYENESIQFWPGVCKIKSATQCYGKGYYNNTYTYLVSAICGRVQ